MAINGLILVERLLSWKPGTFDDRPEYDEEVMNFKYWNAVSILRCKHFVPCLV